jgi:CelD/BcsL family acetyltransferase involved in cellulose biosynthesis
MQKGLSIRTVRGRAALTELTQAWTALQELPGTSPMMRLEWVEAYEETYGAAHPEALQVVVVERNGELVAIAPLVRRPNWLGSSLESVGVTELYEPTDLLYLDEAALRVLADALLRLRLPLAFERLPLNSPTRGALVEAAKGRAFVAERPRIGFPTVRLGTSENELLNAGRRSDLRRARRKAEKLGPITSEILVPKSEELGPLLGCAFELEASGWKSRNASALLCEPETRAFFEAYARRAASSGILRLSFLKIDGRPVAMQYAIECGGALWLLKIGYDEKFATCSPGNILMWDVLVNAIGRGLRTCEFLGNAAPWTRAWTELEHGSERLLLLPFAGSSLVFLTRQSLRKLRKNHGH